MDIFTHSATQNHIPLAALLRPKKLEEFIGQSHILGENKPLAKLIEQDKITSFIFHGPPGVGKTTLANIIAKKTNSIFITLNAISSTVKDIREVIDKAKENLRFYSKKTIVFIDEIHRFNKAQQDIFLPYVEDGSIIFIGATTENPSFSINAPLISRAYVYEFKPLTHEDMCNLLHRALQNISSAKIYMRDEVKDIFIKKSGGDARRLLNVIELTLKLIPPDNENNIVLEKEMLDDLFQHQMINYDRLGSAHYDTASALIKSMRASELDSAVYWLAKMIHGGEDIDFIGRRLAIFAAEDVGNADPHAILVAKAACDVARAIGYPEARIPLSQAVCYLASAPKSKACYNAINSALEDIKQNGVKEIPLERLPEWKQKKK